jgi:hypothetical protein
MSLLVKTVIGDDTPPDTPPDTSVPKTLPYPLAVGLIWSASEMGIGYALLTHAHPILGWFFVIDGLGGAVYDVGRAEGYIKRFDKRFSK